MKSAKSLTELANIFDGFNVCRDLYWRKVTKNNAKIVVQTTIFNFILLL